MPPNRSRCSQRDGVRSNQRCNQTQEFLLLWSAAGRNEKGSDLNVGYLPARRKIGFVPHEHPAAIGIDGTGHADADAAHRCAMWTRALREQAARGLDDRAEGLLGPVLHGDEDVLADQDLPVESGARDPRSAGMITRGTNRASMSSSASGAICLSSELETCTNSSSAIKNTVSMPASRWRSGR